LFADVPSELRDLEYSVSLTDKLVEKTFMGLTKKRFAERVQPAIEVPTLCGNMYCGSVWGGLVSLICNVAPRVLEGKRIGVFSYGSGLASSLLSLKVVGDVGEMVDKVDLHRRLEARKTVEPKVYDEVCGPIVHHMHAAEADGILQMCLLREKAHQKKNFRPEGSIDNLASGTYYLTEVDNMFRRKYEVKA
jgi:hydroxymethylglutaryl-CoA synthase